VAPSDAFARFARWTAKISGRPATFLIAALVIVVWAVTGPVFHFSDTWQLVINTGTTVVTFLMVFLIQNTQNRDAVAMQIKLDELIRAVRGARNDIVDLEESTEEELAAAKQRYEEVARRARAKQGQPHGGGADAASDAASSTIEDGTIDDGPRKPVESGR
jgi:low affinity Fe/Cu permease